MVDLSSPLRIHVCNIGGAGMGAIARILATMGHRVSGHDPTETSFLDPLRHLGVELSIGDDRHPLDPEVTLVAVSTATPADDPDVVEATRRGIPVVHRSDVLEGLGRLKRTIAVAGTHGKTSTSAMLATALDHAGAEPSYLVGAVVSGLGANAAWSDGEWFVVEADESDGSFLHLGPAAAIVTNVEPDHLEHWGGFDALVDVFETFLRDTNGPTVACADDPVGAEVGRRAGAISYGTSPDAHVRIDDIEPKPLGIGFSLHHRDLADDAVRIDLQVPGLHNARNVAATFAVGVAIGLDPQRLAAGLSAYRGVARRFELRGEAGGVTFVDSYDHLPTEVRSALDAARAGDWRRIVCVFQPHRFSRTEALWQEFGDAFDQADLLCLTEVYGAGEAPRPGVSGKLLVDAVLDHAAHKAVAWLPALDDVVAYLGANLRPGDLCLTLGAGDLTTIPPLVMAALERRPA